MTTNKQALRQTAEKAQEHGVFNMEIHSETLLALLDELEAAERRIAELEVQPVTLVLPHDSEVELVADRCNRHRKAKQAAGITTKGE